MNDDDLRATVAALAARVCALEDQMEIAQLVARYGPAVDSGAAAETGALWTEDGSYDSVGALTMNGRDEIEAMVHGSGHQWLIHHGCGHLLTAPQITIDGDRAVGRNHSLLVRWDPQAERFWIARVSANTWTWVRTPEGWRVAERVNANLDGTAEHRALLAPPPAP